MEVKRGRRDPHPALKRARFPRIPRGLALCQGLPERFVGFPARMRTPHLPIGFPVLGASQFRAGGLGPGGTIGPPSRTGLIDYNCVDRALNLLISALEVC